MNVLAFSLVELVRGTLTLKAYDQRLISSTTGRGLCKVVHTRDLVGDI